MLKSVINSFLIKKIKIFFHKSCLSLRSSSLAPLDSGSREFITKCSVVYARVSPQGSRTIDRMTNVPGSHRLHRGLVNQEIFSISMFREAFFLFFFLFFFLYKHNATTMARRAETAC